MATKSYDLDQPLEKLLELARGKFGEVTFEPVVIGDITLEILQIKDMPRYIEKLVGRAQNGKKINLPLWAKIWPACLFLGFYLDKFPFKDDDEILEIGAGVAVIGLVAAKRGFKVTITDIDADALLFSKINALKNGVEDLVKIESVDFTRGGLGKKFDYIIGCEVLYSEEVYKPLHGFLNNHLAETPTAEIVLAMDQKRQARTFFDLAKERYQMMRQACDFPDSETGEDVALHMFRMRRKPA